MPYVSTRAMVVAVALSMLCGGGVASLWGQDSQVYPPGWSRLSSDEQAMVESACRKERMFRGQAGYSNCVSQQLASLGWISKPSLAGVSSDDRAMIESACQTQRAFQGPAAYYSCVSQQLAALGSNPKRPSLAGVSSDDQAMIESACRKQRMMRGPAAYNGCISQQLAALASNPDRPSLAGVAGDQRATIESACQAERMYRGPAAYYGCVSQQLAILSRRERRRLGLQPDEQISFNSGAFGTAHNQAIPQQPNRTGSTGSKLSGSPATKLEAPQPSQTAAASVPMGSGPEDSAPPFSAIAIGVVGTAIALFVLGFGFKLFRRPQRSPCERCGTPVSRAVSHCPSCVVAMQEEARRASAQCQAEERQRPDEQRRQREHAEEEARQSYSSGEETGGHRRQEPADDGPHGFDPYVVLGVARDAGKEDIRAAYLREMARYHPDKVSHLGVELQELAKRKAQAINRAYEELMSSASA
jgi:hypothetical protein